MDYSELTDDEIALLVGKRSGLSDIESECRFDPCNDPSDAWPIILESKISIINYRHSKDEWYAVDRGTDNASESTDNPLRAAMIVYLMMGDDA